MPKTNQRATDPAFPFLAAVRDTMGVPAYAVGGYVRDILLKRPAYDLDVVVEGDALDFAARFAQQTNSPPPVTFERFGYRMVGRRRVSALGQPVGLPRLHRIARGSP